MIDPTQRPISQQQAYKFSSFVNLTTPSSDGALVPRSSLPCGHRGVLLVIHSGHYGSITLLLPFASSKILLD